MSIFYKNGKDSVKIEYKIDYKKGSFLEKKKRFLKQKEIAVEISEKSWQNVLDKNNAN